MERSENEIVAAPPFSTVQVKPTEIFYADGIVSIFQKYSVPAADDTLSRFCGNVALEQAAVGKSHGDKQKCEHGNEENGLLFLRLLPLVGMGAFSAGVISAGAESASGAAVSIFSPQFIQKTASSGIGLPHLGQNIRYSDLS